MGLLLRLPLFLLLTVVACLAMWVPAVYALALDDFHDARSFFYSGLLGLIVAGMVALALANRATDQSPMRQLLGLLAGFAFLPVLLAVPFVEAVRNTTFLNAYVEMLSSLTTTGATLFEPGRLSGPEHLWRALVGWLGGLLMWIAASAVLAPLTLGGFEVTASGEPGQSVVHSAAGSARASSSVRLARSIEVLVPTYAGLTLALTVCLLVAGDDPLVAICHAMSVLSTSGISPIGGVQQSNSGFGGEVLLFLFMAFALSRLTFSSDTAQAARRGLYHDPEFRLGIGIVVLVPLALFMRHWVGAFDVGGEENLFFGLRALWGGLFTAMSFLTTTGFVSGDWSEAQSWSGLPTPGIILLALALVGGGVATTAGGVKLLRVFALAANGRREIERLVYPSSVGRAGLVGRRIRREGAFIAWVFFMLFAVTLAALTLILGIFGIGFDASIILAIAALTNTGPLVAVASDQALNLLALAPGAKLALCTAMVLGRLELLAIIVLLSPEIWRE